MNAQTMASSWQTLLERVSAASEQPVGGDPLAEVDKAIKALVFYDDALAPDENLVHYTSWENALAILKEPRPVLRSYNYERTNDPQEGRLLRGVWDEDLSKKAEWFQKFLPTRLCSTLDEVRELIYVRLLLLSGRSWR